MTFIGTNNGLVVVPQGGPPGPLGPIGPAGPNIYPTKTLFVSKGGWPLGANPLIYFTDIQLALNQAAALLPTRTDPAAIIIYPGTYPENLTLVSNVSLVGTTKRGCRLLGDIAWNAGQGVNAALINAREEVLFSSLRVIGTNFLVDTSAKTGDLSVLDAIDCSWVDNFVAVNRAGINQDYFQCSNILFSDITITDGVCDIHNSEVLANTNTFIINGNCDFGLNSVIVFQDLVLNNTGHVGSPTEIAGCYFDSGITVNDTHKARIIGSEIKGNLNVAVGAEVDIRSTECPQANILGTGIINRRVVRITTGATVFGVNAIVISPPLGSNNYNVSASLVSGPGGQPLLITNKLGTGFDLDDPTGGNVWDLTIIQD